jgi:DNA (cytosine-5)-methyltransferase 1
MKEFFAASKTRNTELERTKSSMTKRQKKFDPPDQSGDLGLFPKIVVPEAFRLSQDGKTITRKVSIANYEGSASFPATNEPFGLDIDASFEKSWLMAKRPPDSLGTGPRLRVVDLFAGCGGLSVGIQAASQALDGRFESVFASDIDEGALQVYSANLSPKHTCSKPIEETFVSELKATLNMREKRLKEQCGQLDFLIGGPPCQGHSDLNNHTRRNDPRNDLYAVMGRAATVLQPKFIIIENVLGVRHSSTEVVQKTLNHLNGLGYQTASIMLNAANYGVAQNRKRHFTLAMFGNPEILHCTLMALVRKVRPVMWAIDDIIDESESSPNVFTTAATHSATNKERISYLFQNNLYELPDSERPDCHRLKPHAYNSVYGRMRPDAQAPTITSGFGSTGQGRFVHPFRRRTLTPHEAARIQFFPDWFSFDDLGRRQLQKYIGNAVPPKLGYVLGLALLNTGGGIHE